MQVKLLAEGGAMKPGPALSQKLGPAGVPINNVIQKVNEATTDFKGMKVPVELDIDVGTKEIHVKVSSPPVSELLKKEFGIEKGSGLQDKIKVANVSIEQIISIAKTKMPNLLCRDLRASVKTVLGSCVSLGILVEDKSPKEVLEEIDQGKYDKEIKEEKTETSEEKKKQLDENFEQIKKQQEKFVKAQEAKKAEEKTEEKPAEEKDKEENK
jgi:large subunit ribosomal protein L11